MMELAGYRVSALMYKGPNAIVYRGTRESDGRPVVIKQLNRTYPAPGELDRFRREGDTMRLFDSDAIVRLFGMEKYRNTLVLVMEDFGGVSIDRLLPDWSFDPQVFLNLAIRIASALSLIHQQHIIHSDIHPGNILWNPETDIVKITDFGIASPMSGEIPEAVTPGDLEGTLAYMSPEQTGRTNRPVDYRTDYYSFGVTLYHIATGRLPFASDDPATLVHSHLARPPKPPDECNPVIPAGVSDIILKCMAKTAEERYQSSFGLIADLRTCLDRLREGKPVDAFSLGAYDRSGKFEIPGMLYGRDEQVEEMARAFGRACLGAKEMFLVAGNPGVGKTAVVEQVRKNLVREPAWFICGKYNRLEQRTPYSAWIQVIRDLVQQLVVAGGQTLSAWKTAILESLGRNCRLVLELVPDLELIIGEQPLPPRLPPVEAQNRFNLTFLKFIRVIARQEHLPVIFLDDLQWADDASLKMIERVMKDDETGRLLLLGTYRDTEADASPSFLSMVDDLRQSGIPVTTRTLQPLNRYQVNRFVSDTLRSPPEETGPLAGICFQKTGGNPLFLIQLLQSFFKEGRIRCNAGCNGWDWDVDEIRRSGITEDIADLMTRRIDGLPGKTETALFVASCIGMEFDAETASLFNETLAAKTVEHLDVAVEEGLVIRTDGGAYRFSHDRIQQAAYALIAPEARQAIHLEIGRQIYRHTPQGGLDEAVFQIVNQLNCAIDSITDAGERLLLAELNLRAGKKAKASAAFESAGTYLETGIALLPENSWQRSYPLTHALYTEAAEAAFCCTKFDTMEERTNAVIAHARTLVDTVNCYDLKIQYHYARNELLKVVEEGLRLLKKLGYPFSENPKTPWVVYKLLRTNAMLAGKKTRELTELEEMQDPEVMAAIRIMRNLAHAAYGARPNLNPMLGFESIRLSLKYGIAPESASGFAGFAMLLCGFLGDIKNGTRFGELALRLSRRECARRFRAQTAFLVTAMVDHWKTPLRDTLPTLFSTYRLGLELGDLEFATLSLFFHDAHRFFAGARLDELGREMADHSRTIDHFKQETHFYFNEMVRQAVLNLMDRAEDPCRLKGEAYDEAEMLPIHRDNNDMSAVFMLCFYKMYLNYLFGHMEEALACSREAKSLIRSMVSTAWIPLFYFYDSLICLAAMAHAGIRTRKRGLRRVSRNQKKLKKWAKYAPMNHLHKWTLVEAERFRVAGKISEAMDHYDRAIQGAAKQEYLQEEALANELAATFWFAVNKTGVGEHYLAKALHCYEIWGAAAKVGHLHEKYPFMAPYAGKPSTTGVPGATTASTLSEALDLDAVLTALHALSGEIVFDELMQKMMAVVIENAGAQKASLLFRDENGWVVDAEGTIFENTIQTRIESRKALPLVVPLSVIQYCALTRQTVVLNDAPRDSRFGRDPYIEKHLPRSVLCVPIFHQGNLSGLLYLENRLAAGTFTADRLDMISILASQTAISIENARLYTRLKASEEKYRSIFENAVEGIFQVSADGHFISANQAMADILGVYSPDEMIGTSARGLIDIFSDPDARHRVARVLDSEGQLHHFEDTVVRADAAVFWGSISIRAVRSDGGGLRFFEGSLVDITERKNREKAEQETREARAAAKAKSEFLANMSHEIRTPMTAIVGLADILLKSPMAEKQKENLQQIKGTSRSLMRIIDDILDFSKIEAGKLRFDPTDFNLSEILNKIACLFAGSHAGKDVEMLFSISTGTPDRLVGDPLRVEQVLINLISNAFKFTQKGAILIGVQPMQFKNGRVKLQFYVEDTGIGIAEESMAGLFEAFTQADGTISRKYGGTGLGLTISKKIVELMEGRIWVERNDNPGSTFYFTLTLGCRESGSRPPLRLPAGMAAKTVLIVDDNTVSRHLLERQISGFGMRVDTCASGEQAVGKLRNPANRGRYDLVLMDEKMPGLGGIEAARRIRTDLEGAAPPIIIMENRFESDMFDPEGDGVQSFLAKPVLPEALYGALFAAFTGDGGKMEASADPFAIPPEFLRQLRGLKILLVDDNPINRMILVELMEGADIDIDVCEDGRQAVAAVGRKSYDAVLMDIQMPGMDGYETTRLIRETKGPEELPVIAISAHAFEEHKQAGREAGMNDFISKPIDLNDLLSTLAANLTERPADDMVN